MSLTYFEKMHSRSAGTYTNDPMQVYLYPWSRYQKSAVQQDGIVTNAIKAAADQLFDHGAIDYYAIYRWKYERSDTNYPDWGDIDNCSMNDIMVNFRSFVKNTGNPDNTCGYVNKNGAQESHYDNPGVHQLIHGGYTGCNETEGYAPAGAGAESDGQTAFNEGRVAWSPVCSDDSLTRAAAIQETTHCFIHPDYDETRQCSSVNDYPREHSLGTINYYFDINWAECTPMLTYHWDDFGGDSENPDCPCPVDLETTPDTHTTTLTSCTKDSVKNTATNF